MTPTLLSVMADNTAYVESFHSIHEQLWAYMLTINLPDVLATLIIGTITIIASELYHHTSCDKKTNLSRVLMVIPVGWAGAIMGGEIATLAGGNNYSWLYVVAITWIGGSALDKFATLILGIMEKAVSAIGARQDEDVKRNTDNRQRQSDMQHQIQDVQFKQELEKLQASPKVDNL